MLPDDVQHIAQAVLAHRLILSAESVMARRSASDVLRDIMSRVPIPVAAR